MTQTINLKELEKNAWTSTFQDGIVDIGLGLILVVTTITDDSCDSRSDSILYPLFNCILFKLGPDVYLCCLVYVILCT